MANTSKESAVLNKDQHKIKRTAKFRQVRILRQFTQLSLYMKKENGSLIPAAGGSNAAGHGKTVKLKQYKYKKKVLKKMDHHKVLLILCGFPELVEQSETAAKLLLLILMSQVFHFMAGVLPALPVLTLNSPPQLACAIIGPLLDAVQGPETWRGKGWCPRRSWIIHPQIALGETTLSTSIMDYLGGKCKDRKGKKREFYFPYIASSVLMMPGLPAAVFKQIISLSPLAMPIIPEQWKGNGLRPMLALNSQPLDAYDADGMEVLKQSAQHCHMQIAAFLTAFCGDASYLDDWRENILRFRPVARKGRFSQPQSDLQTELLCAALSFFQQFLRYASEDALWISREEARELLLRYWRWALPGSAPIDSEPGGSAAARASACRYYEPQVFYHFLAEYFVPTYLGQILRDAKGLPGTMAVIRKLDGEDWFIAPRKRLLEVYARWLTERKASAFEISNEAAVQRQMLEAGLPLRGEKTIPPPGGTHSIRTAGTR